MTELISRDDLVAALETGAVTVVDALPAEYYDRTHIPGAMNLVEADVEVRAAQLLPDRHATIVTYCSNAACQNSQSVAQRLARLGYTDVRKYRDGIQDWVAAGLPTETSVSA